MSKKKKPRTVSLPVFGLWEKMGPIENPEHGCGLDGCGTGWGNPSPAQTLIGLWLLPSGKTRVGMFAAMYCDEDGEYVDPFCEEWAFIVCESRQGGGAVGTDGLVPPPDYYADTRFLIEVEAPKRKKVKA